MKEAPAPWSIHATALVVGEWGILIEGASGSGKSALAAALIAHAQGRGTYGCLVADDRVVLQSAGTRLLARPHPAVAGLLEQRGLGLLGVPYEPACVVRLVVRLSDARPERLPDDMPAVVLGGVTLPLLNLPQSAEPYGNACRTAAALPLLAPLDGGAPISLLIPSRCTR